MDSIGNSWSHCVYPSYANNRRYCISHCRIKGADRVDGSDPEVLSDVMNQYPLHKHAHLEKRILLGGIVFNWVDPEGSFDGREQHILSVFDTKYSNEQHETYN